MRAFGAGSPTVALSGERDGAVYDPIVHVGCNPGKGREGPAFCLVITREVCTAIGLSHSQVVLTPDLDYRLVSRRLSRQPPGPRRVQNFNIRINRYAKQRIDITSAFNRTARGAARASFWFFGVRRCDAL